MLLTVANFLPPAIGRLPFAFIQSHPVPFGLGIPVGLAVPVRGLRRVEARSRR
jgi:hypothetical protein